MFNEWLCRFKFSSFIRGLLVVIGVLPLVLISLISISISKSALEDSAYNQLNVSRSIKEKEVENYFIEREADTRLLSKTLSVFYQSATIKLDRFSRLKSRDIEFFLENVDKEVTLFSRMDETSKALKAFSNGVEKGKFSKGESWKNNREKYSSSINEFKDLFDWHNVYLISPSGKVTFSALQGNELGLDLMSSDMMNTSLHKAFIRAKKSKIKCV